MEMHWTIESDSDGTEHLVAHWVSTETRDLDDSLAA